MIDSKSQSLFRITGNDAIYLSELLFRKGRMNECDRINRELTR